MRALFLKRYRNLPIKKLTSGSRRQKASFYFVLSVFLLQIILTTATPLYVVKAQAATANPPALKTEKQQTTSLESGASGTPLKNAPSATNDPATFKSKEVKEEEIVDKRGEFTSSKRNKDGTVTVTQSNDRINYKKGNKWEKIDTTLVEDTNAADSNAVGGVLGKVKSVVVKEQKTFKVKENDWQARFAPSNDKIGMLRYQKGSLTLVYRPVGANKVTPKVENTQQGQVVTYANLWNGIDVQYEVTNSKIKEFIAFKNKNAQTNIEFKIDGAILEAIPERPGAFKVVGHDVEIAELSVALNGSGVISETVATQVYEDWKIKISLDQQWLKSLTDDKFPVVIDPTTTGHYQQGLNYTAFKSDGYVCGSNSCYMNAGTLNDNGWKHWRTIFCPNYNDFLQPQLQRRIHWAGLYLNKKNPPPNYWFGVPEGRWFEVSHATSWQFHSINYGLPRTSAWFAQDGWINMTPQMQYFAHNNIGGACFVINGEEVAGNTYKAFIDNALMQYTYSDQTSMPTPISPADKEVMITDQPTLSVNPSTSPNGDQVRYYFRITTNPDAETGTVINSGDVDATTWTIPEGTLQDGQTYYWHTYSSRWVNGVLQSYTNPNWVRSFKYDARTGNDSTQSYDQAGPISIGLSTGNATTSAATHSMSALGGAIGIGLEYNSPVKSKPGLLGEYYNNNSLSGNPSVTRVEQNINFSWATGSPSAGTIGQDNFSAKYTGYFVVPKTGSYQFGGTRDDVVRIYVNNVPVVNASCCGLDWSSAISLNEGDVIPLRVEYIEYGGHATVAVRVKGAVPDQIIPSEWLRTPLRQTNPTTGLQSFYYADTNNHTVPTATNTAFASRVESNISFNYGLGSAVPTGPVDNFISSHNGFITVPTTGTYTFGTVADDAARVWVNGQLVVNDWAHDGLVSTVWGTPITLTGGKTVPIKIEYYEIGGGAALRLNVKGAVTEQIVPATWLSSKAQVVPHGWAMSLDADGNLSYDYAKITPQTVTLHNASGDTHVYTWNGSVYTPPTDEYGVMVRNQDGTITLQDADGRTYIFDNDGRLKEVTTPSDDLKPAALKYQYSGLPGRLTKIVDGVDPARFGTVHYKGDAACPAVSGGILGVGGSSFDASAPDNMLCAFTTTDGDKTSFYYVQGKLARIELPGGDITDIGYDSYGRITQQRSSLAFDAITANVRGNDAGVTSQVQYDAIGRVSKVIEPAPNAGDTRREHSYNYSIQSKTSWSQPEEITGQPIAGNVVVANWGGDKLIAVARSTTNSTLYRTYQNGTWTEWIDIGGTIQDDPGVASWIDGRFDIFVRGMDNTLYAKVFENGIWTVPVWTSLGGGYIYSSPSATSWAYQRYDVEAKGVSGQLLHRSWTPATGWTAFQDRGGCMSSAPSVSTWGANRLSIYMKGCNNPSTIYSLHYDQGWQAYGQNSTEQVASAIGSVSTTAKEIHMATRNPSNQLRYRYYNGTFWTDFETVAACTQGNPTVTYTGTTTAIVIYKGCDGKLYQQKQTLVAGTTTMRSTNSSEPNGYSEKVEYDKTLRTVRDYDKAGNSNFVEYHPIEDQVLSTTGAMGLKSTTIYDQNDLPIESYGSAPKDWFNASRRPHAAYAAQVPRSDTKYDEGINGLNVSWYDVTNKTLFGSPKLHTTGIRPTAPTAMGRNFASDGVPFTRTAGFNGYGFRATGKVLFPTTGTYTFNFYHSDGARLYIDNKSIVNYWADSAAVRTDTGTFVAVAGKSYDIRVEYYSLSSNTSAGLSIGARLGSNTENGDWAAIGIQLKPDYNLQTSTKIYDAQLGDTTTTTNYGPTPELGLPASVTEDASGLNLTTSMTYEAAGASGSYLRQTSKTMAGGNTYTYSHYGATEVVDNPCTIEQDAVSQAGLPKGKTEPDPDLSGPLTGRKTEAIYNKSGDVVATRFNNDPWACSFYDARGRTIRTEAPSINGAAARTLLNSYAVNGNPFKNSSSDNSGAITVEIDLVGRTKSYKDTYENTTITNYDANGRLSSRTGPLGTEEFVYDTLDRLVTQKLDSVPFANVSYDVYSQITNIAYQSGQSVQYVRDTLNRLKKITYTLQNGQTISDEVNRSVGGDVINGVENGINKSYTYDKSSRLTSATIGSNTFNYTYGATNTTCSAYAGNNVNAHKNGNRSSMTQNGVATNYCYNNADQLTFASNAAIGVPQYDAHGNTTKLGVGTSNQLEFAYDGSDRNTQIISINPATASGTAIQYTRDLQNRIVKRRSFTISNWNWNQISSARYGFTGSSDTPDFIQDESGAITEKYLSLPGSVLVTIRTNRPSAGGITYSLPNIHGDVMATVDADGTLSGTHMTGPFGEVLAHNALKPANTVLGTTYNYVGQHQKLTESDLGLAGGIIQMGARIYIPILGRFLTVDPIEGGTDNAYVYVGDPVNDFDLDGTFNWKKAFKAVAVASDIASIIPGPIGMAASGVAAAGYLAAGDKKAAAIAIGGIALAAVGAGALKYAKYASKGSEFKSSLALGQKAHKVFQKRYGLAEHTLKPFGRADGFRRGVVYELKPHNTRAIKMGIKQLERYSKHKTVKETQLWTYKKTWYGGFKFKRY